MFFPTPGAVVMVWGTSPFMEADMKQWVFNYHFPYLTPPNHVVYAKAQHWTGAAARADRDVARRPGVKGRQKADIFTRSCEPISLDAALHGINRNMNLQNVGETYHEHILKS